MQDTRDAALGALRTSERQQGARQRPTLVPRAVRDVSAHVPREAQRATGRATFGDRGGGPTYIL